MLHVLKGLSALAGGNIKFSQLCVSFSNRIVLLFLEDSFSNLSFLSPTFTSVLQQDLNCLCVDPSSLGSASQILTLLESLNSNLCLLNSIGLCLGSFSLLYSLEPLSRQLTRASMGSPCLFPFSCGSLITLPVVQCLKTHFVYFFLVC